jgi:hypothetical protein
MKVQFTRQNVSERELATALAGIATEEGVTHEVHELLDVLVKADHKDAEDIIPERYMRYIGERLVSDFRSLLIVLMDNVEIWIEHQSKSKRSIFKSLSKADDENTPLLTQDQLDELQRLIEHTFRSAIGLNYSASDDQKKSWQKIGIKDANVSFENWIINSYLVGKVAELVNNKTSYADAIKLVKKLPMSRLDKLTIDMAKQNSAKYILGYASKLGGLATDVALDQHKKSINAIIQSYFKGELNREYRADGEFSLEEQSVIHKVTSWRQLASEFRDRFKQTDLLRDWERVAFTEMRYATNLGRIVNIQQEGGGDAEDIEVFYHVLPSACSSCKKLYLEVDGVTPKIFKLSQIIDNVAKTGGLNVGRKASLIGKADGWIPNAVTHPNCHCYQVRKIAGYKYAEFAQSEVKSDGTK